MPAPTRSRGHTLAVLVALAILVAPAFGRAEPRLKQVVARALERIKLPPRLKNAIDKRVQNLRLQCTRLADRVECRLPGRMRPAFQKLRLFNPLTVSGFAARRFRQDPVFLASYGVISHAVDFVKMPLLLGAGVNPLVALAVDQVTGTPLTLAVIAWRQHHLRTDRSQTFRQTTRNLFGEYREFALARRAEDRQLIAGRAGSGLAALGSGLSAAPVTR